jgi:hypothetical protein
MNRPLMKEMKKYSIMKTEARYAIGGSAEDENIKKHKSWR